MIYGQVCDYDFITFDDNVYVYENSHVQEGLTPESIKWAFTNTDTGLWIPVTWLSFMLDYELFGLNPGRFHRTNVILHIANTLLLFLLFHSMTRALWKSAFLAGFFALHPLQVESVAWVTERKDVLSIFFMLIALTLYLRYIKQPTVYRYFSVFFTFLLGLMAKPIIVTFPLLLLLVDYWPLERLPYKTRGKKSNRTGEYFNLPWMRIIKSKILLEKIPFFTLSIVVSVITLIAARKGEALMQLNSLSFGQRLSNSLVSYATYISKIFWPSNLAIFYPHEAGTVPLWKIIGAFFVLFCITFTVIRLRKQFPYFLFGWLWFLGTLIPVIGLFQTGSQSIADRFTYMPIIGIIITVIWGGSAIMERWLHQRVVTSIFAVMLLLLLSTASWFQIGYWRDSIALFSHAVKVTSSNWLAHNSLGIGFERQGNLTKAVEHYSRAIYIKPDYYYAHYNLARVYGLLGNYAEASEHFAEVLDFKPDFAEANYNLALALVNQGKFDDADEYYLNALKINPDFEEAHYNLALVMQNQGKFSEASEHFIETLRINKNNYFAHYNLARIHANQKNFPAAVKHYSEALRLSPDFAEAHYNLGNIHAQQGNLTQAIEHYNEALRCKPDYAEALNTLGNVLEYQGNLKEAVAQYSKALRIQPDSAVLHRNMGGALKKQGKNKEAEAHFSEAMKLEYKKGQSDAGENK